MMRVKDNKLYWDWPWGRGRIEHYRKANNTGAQLQRVGGDNMTDASLPFHVLKILAVDDSVFLIGGEMPSLPWQLPFPSFSCAPKMTTSEMPLPWPEMWRKEMLLYKAAVRAGGDFSDEFFVKKADQRLWDKRIPKAAFFSSYREQRRLIYDQAALRPDLIDAPLHYPTNVQLEPWNKNSPEPQFRSREELLNWTTQGRHPTEPGFVSHLANISRANDTRYTPGHYKYVVVMGYAMSTSGRLAYALAHSGAVVLLAKSPFSYHFSSRLVPWVHYVPLSFSASDLVQKIEWLRDNDGMARQLALNAKNFGKSYLRM